MNRILATAAVLFALVLAAAQPAAGAEQPPWSDRESCPDIQMTAELTVTPWALYIDCPRASDALISYVRNGAPMAGWTCQKLQQNTGRVLALCTMTEKDEWGQLPSVQATYQEVTAPPRVVDCTDVAYAGNAVDVTAAGVACTPARTMLAAYLKRGVEPAGFVCVKLAVGKQRTAKCASAGRANRAVTGRWRVR